MDLAKDRIIILSERFAKILGRQVEKRHFRKQGDSEETEEAGASKALICCSICLHKLTLCNFSSCQQHLSRMLPLCMCVCGGACECADS